MHDRTVYGMVVVQPDRDRVTEVAVLILIRAVMRQGIRIVFHRAVQYNIFHVSGSYDMHERAIFVVKHGGFNRSQGASLKRAGRRWTLLVLLRVSSS